MSPTFRNASRDEFDGTNKTLENINAGSLQRIADACEKMAANWSTLVRERDQYKRWYEERRVYAAKCDLRIRSLRGAATRAKRRPSKEATSK